MSEQGDRPHCRYHSRPISRQRRCRKNGALRRLERSGELDIAGKRRLASVEADYDQALAAIGSERDRMVAAVRAVAERFRPYAKIFVGGVPKIAADMNAFVRSD